MLKRIAVNYPRNRMRNGRGQQLHLTSAKERRIFFTWRKIPVRKWLVTLTYKPFRPFGRGTTLFRGLTITMVINHLLTAMILQVEKGWPNPTPTTLATIRDGYEKNQESSSPQKNDLEIDVGTQQTAEDPWEKPARLCISILNEELKSPWILSLYSCFFESPFGI